MISLIRSRQIFRGPPAHEGATSLFFRINSLIRSKSTVCNGTATVLKTVSKKAKNRKAEDLISSVVQGELSASTIKIGKKPKHSKPVAKVVANRKDMNKALSELQLISQFPGFETSWSIPKQKMLKGSRVQQWETEVQLRYQCSAISPNISGVLVGSGMATSAHEAKGHAATQVLMKLRQSEESWLLDAGMCGVSTPALPSGMSSEGSLSASSSAPNQDVPFSDGGSARALIHSFVDQHDLLNVKWHCERSLVFWHASATVTVPARTGQLPLGAVLPPQSTTANENSTEKATVTLEYPPVGSSSSRVCCGVGLAKDKKEAEFLADQQLAARLKALGLLQVEHRTSGLSGGATSSVPRAVRVPGLTSAGLMVSLNVLCKRVF
jgi:hypothetical protein